MRRILVTGAATWTGGRLIQRLERRAGFHILAVDEVSPRLEFTSPFQKMGLDRTEFAHFVLDVAPETVVHLETVDRAEMLGRSRAHELAVVGAQALFGAVGRCEATKHVIVKSDAAIYGSSPRNPSVLREDTQPHGRRCRYPRDLSEMEQFVGEMGATHDHVDYTILRFAGIFGPNVGNPLSRFLRLPIVPTLMGFDPRFQFIFEDDAVALLEHAILNPVAGTFNAAASGQIYLSRVLRLGKRIGQQLPRRGFDAALSSLARLDLYVPEHIRRLVKHGMVTDTTRMEQDLGFTPKRNCRQTVLAAYGQRAEAPADLYEDLP